MKKDIFEVLETLFWLAFTVGCFAFVYYQFASGEAFNVSLSERQAGLFLVILCWVAYAAFGKKKGE